jgi:O-antigen/teichoic acid export membrane protein
VLADILSDILGGLFSGGGSTKPATNRDRVLGAFIGLAFAAAAVWAWLAGAWVPAWVLGAFAVLVLVAVGINAVWMRKRA